MTVEALPQTGYHKLPENQYDGEKAAWKTLSADYSGVVDPSTGGVAAELRIDGHPVMEAWEQPYMAALASVATSKGGRVLEVGFGLGLSATAIQGHTIQEHIIIEANEGVLSRGKEWAARQPNAVRFLHGLWQEALEEVPDNSLDGVLYDTYPLTKEEQHVHQFDFIRKVFPKLKEGGVLTYCNLTSIGVLKGEHKDWDALWRETQVPHLEGIGFRALEYETFSIRAPEQCEYYSGHTEALVPICHK